MWVINKYQSYQNLIIVPFFEKETPKDIWELIEILTTTSLFVNWSYSTSFPQTFSNTQHVLYLKSALDPWLIIPLFFFLFADATQSHVRCSFTQSLKGKDFRDFFLKDMNKAWWALRTSAWEANRVTNSKTCLCRRLVMHILLNHSLYWSLLIPHISQVKTWFQNRWNKGKRENLGDNLEAKKL